MILRDAEDYDETELGWAMLNLKQKRDAFLETASAKNYVAFKEAAESVVIEYDRKPSLTTALEFPVYFLEFWAELQKEKFDVYDFFNDLDVFTEILIKTNNFSAVVNTADKEKIIACACLTRVSVADIGVSHPKESTVNQLISTLLGKNVSLEQINTAEACANLLYSPAALVLYGDALDDLDDCTELARHIYLLDLPIAKPAQSATPELPVDLSY